MKKYVSYIRVSTAKQGQSGLGLEAQRQAVQSFLKDADHLTEFVEIESGKKDRRPQLVAAIYLAKANGATLVIAKLDRLSRNAAFIFKLRDTKVDFVCCDMPDANTLTVGIMAVMAQHERELTSKRTKDALAAKKAQGAKLGTPKNLGPEAIRKGVTNNQQAALYDDSNRQATEYILLLHEKGFNYLQIARRLNDLHLKTRRGKTFGAEQVKRLYLRAITPRRAINFKFKNEEVGTATAPIDAPAAIVAPAAVDFKFKKGHLEGFFTKYLPLAVTEAEKLAIYYLNDVTQCFDRDHVPNLSFEHLRAMEVETHKASNLPYFLKHYAQGIAPAELIAGVTKFAGAYWLESGAVQFPPTGNFNKPVTKSNFKISSFL